MRPNCELSKLTRMIYKKLGIDVQYVTASKQIIGLVK